MKQKKNSGVVRVHNNRFYNFKPRPIYSISQNRKLNRLALSRTGIRAIEIWNVKDLPYLERTLPAPDGLFVKSLIWSGKRLFTIGAKSVKKAATGGAIRSLSVITEWDWRSTLRILREVHLTGNNALCLDANSAGTEIAVGTAEGYINILNVESPDDLVPKKLYDRISGNILCCKYSHAGDFLVTGSEGVIQIWNTSTGQALHRFKVRYERVANVRVQSLAVLRDMTIIAGDSTGRLSIWDGKKYARLQLIKVLDTALLSIVACNRDMHVEAEPNEIDKPVEDMIICAGQDPGIQIIVRTTRTRDQMESDCWITALKRSVHARDINAVVYMNERIYSGGMDGYLCATGALKKMEAAKYGPFLQTPCAMSAPNAELLLLRYPNLLELYQLGSVSRGAVGDVLDERDKSQRRILPMASVPRMLLKLEARRGQLIVSAAISSDGCYICYATQYGTRLFKYARETNELTRITVLSRLFLPASHLRFSADSRRLFILNSEHKKLVICELNGKELDLVETIELDKNLSGPTTHFVLSDSAKYFAIATADHCINVWCRQPHDMNYKHHLSLPRNTAATTALALNPKQPYLVAAYADNKIIEYDLEELCFTCSSNKCLVQSSATHCTLNILIDEKHTDSLLLHNEMQLFSVRKLKPDELQNDNKSPVQAKKPRKIETQQYLQTLQLKAELNYDHLVHIDRLQSGELVLVGVDSTTLIQNLAPISTPKKFGVS